jgi:hypothetical protein
LAYQANNTTISKLIATKPKKLTTANNLIKSARVRTLYVRENFFSFMARRRHSLFQLAIPYSSKP